MTGYLKYASAAVTLFVLSACMAPAGIPYSPSFENIDRLKAVAPAGTAVRMGEFSLSEDANVSLQCRLVGKVDVAHGGTIPDFVREAVQQEFAAAGLYDREADNRISMEIRSVDVQTFGDAGWSIIAYVSSDTHSGYVLKASYPLESLFDGYAACRLATVSFGKVVRRLVDRMIDHPDFLRLIGALDQEGDFSGQ